MEIFRRARASDACEIGRLYSLLVANPAVHVLPERLEQLERSSTAVFVAEAGAKLLGTILVVLCDDVMFGDQPFAVVENVIVDPCCRGQGIGTRLIQEVERHCLIANCSKIMLLSAKERPVAHSFFERHGYAGDRKRGFVKYRSAFEAVG